jgi:hypothetical protein
MKNLLMLPLWLVQVFTWSKSFRSNPIIGSPTLNRLGLHVLRVAAAEGLFQWRLWLLSPLVGREDRKMFREQGYILKRDFLPPEAFAALKGELQGYRGEITDVQEGDTRTQRVLLTRKALQGLPRCRALVETPALDRAMRYASSKNRPPLYYIENLRLKAADSALRDPQQDFHTDSFHPCVKAWLFIDDVSTRNAPHVYVPGSHRLTWKRLQWEYRESLAASAAGRQPAGDRYWDGSFRVTQQHLRDMGCNAPQSFQVPGNTLLIANVHGFHRRGDATEPSARMTIWMQARDNPFNPLVSLFPRLSARLVEDVWCHYARRRDERRAAAGQLRRIRGGFDRTSMGPPAP